MSYAEVFPTIEKEVVESTKQLLKNGIWKKDFTQEEKIQACKTWLEEVSEIYQVSPPSFTFEENESRYHQTGGGCCYGSSIILYSKFSLTTLLHEFRHYLQWIGKVEEMYRNHVEHDARAWSVSLFKLAAPKSYQKAVDNGTLHFN